jgi:hypothetical protein
MYASVCMTSDIMAREDTAPRTELLPDTAVPPELSLKRQYALISVVVAGRWAAEPGTTMTADCRTGAQASLSFDRCPDAPPPARIIWVDSANRMTDDAHY